MSNSRNLPKIYLVDSSIAITGAFICARREAEQLKGVAQVCLVLPIESRISDDQLEPFERVIRLPILNLRRSLRAIVLYLPLLLKCSWQLCRHMKEDRAERLQLNDFNLMHGAVCRLFGYRGIIVSWIRFDPSRFGSLLSKLWMFFASATSNRMVAVSRFIQSVVPGIETVLLYDSVFCSKSSKTVIDIPSDQGARKLVYIGNYIDGKGQDDAVAALASLVEEFPDLTLEFYGGDMGLEKNRIYRRRLEDSVARQGMQHRVYFGDFVENPAVVLHNALAALNFSYSESFSMTVLEAADAGIPVIATRSGGPQEIIKNRETGLLVPIGDVPAMSAAIKELASDPGWASMMGQAGHLDVRRRFSQASFLAGLKDLFELPPDQEN